MIHAADRPPASFTNPSKLAIPKLKARTAVSTHLIRSKRLLGTLHLPAFVWPR
jgi:hypothetical protein